MFFKKKSRSFRGFVDWDEFIAVDRTLRILQWQQQVRAESLRNALAEGS